MPVQHAAARLLTRRMLPNLSSEAVKPDLQYLTNWILLHRRREGVSQEGITKEGNGWHCSPFWSTYLCNGGPCARQDIRSRGHCSARS